METTIYYLILIIGLCSGLSPYIAEPKDDDPWWMERHKIFFNNSLSTGASISVMFLGDSITESWNDAGKDIFESKYAPLGSVNYGIYGDQIENVLWRVINGELETVNPKLFVINIGTNNFLLNDDLDIAAGISTLIGVLRGLRPSSKVLLLGILPRQNNTANFRVRKVNSLISRLDDGKFVRFLDMYDGFVDSNGSCDPNLYESDLLHLVTPGYQRWSEIMDPLFMELLS